MKLFAISDLHLRYEKNRELLEEILPHKEDWLILGGDLGEGKKDLQYAFEKLQPKFSQLVWVPGNHELWTMADDRSGLRGEYKYQELVSFCRSYGVLTPEAAYVKQSFGEKDYYVVPAFTHYDYSFRPDNVELKDVIAWAQEEDIISTDESLLHPDPYSSSPEWCHAQVSKTLKRLELIPREVPIVLINHYPLRRDLVRLHRVPRYSPWCGTRLTEDWHKRFNIEVVVSGHLHVRATDWKDGVRFEEVSLGYPRQRNSGLSADSFLREILPASASKEPGEGVLIWTY